MRLFLSLVSGAVFGVGLWISGMAQPAKVIGFLDVFGRWDPSLALVLLAAVSTTMLGYKIVFARTAPLLAERFHLPERTRIDGRLIGGSALFGVGWGLGGYCPAPALTGLTLVGTSGFVFVTAMLAGILLVRRLDRLEPAKALARVRA